MENVEEVVVPVEDVVPEKAKYKEPKVSREELLKQILELRQDIKETIDTSVQETLIFKLSGLENLYAKGVMDI